MNASTGVRQRTQNPDTAHGLLWNLGLLAFAVAAAFTEWLIERLAPGWHWLWRKPEDQPCSPGVTALLYLVIGLIGAVLLVFALIHLGHRME